MFAQRGFGNGHRVAQHHRGCDILAERAMGKRERSRFDDVGVPHQRVFDIGR